MAQKIVLLFVNLKRIPIPLDWRAATNKIWAKFLNKNCNKISMWETKKRSTELYEQKYILGYKNRENLEAILSDIFSFNS